ncbi:MAG: hypothetical protein LVQ95_03100 [Candidatus Micrarchaeales archaeon]|nr:hypothetical protein [Candidatus Micrarchaeales archaeon]
MTRKSVPASAYKPGYNENQYKILAFLAERCGPQPNSTDFRSLMIAMLTRTNTPTAMDIGVEAGLYKDSVHPQADGQRIAKKELELLVNEGLVSSLVIGTVNGTALLGYKLTENGLIAAQSLPVVEIRIIKHLERRRERSIQNRATIPEITLELKLSDKLVSHAIGGLCKRGLLKEFKPTTNDPGSPSAPCYGLPDAGEPSTVKKMPPEGIFRNTAARS